MRTSLASSSTSFGEESLTRIWFWLNVVPDYETFEALCAICVESAPIPHEHEVYVDFRATIVTHQLLWKEHVSTLTEHTDGATRLVPPYAQL